MRNTRALLRIVARNHGWTHTEVDNVATIIRADIIITVEFSRNGGVKYAQRMQGDTARGFAFRIERDKRTTVLGWLTTPRSAPVAA